MNVTLRCDVLCCGGALRCCGAQSCSSFVGTSKGGIASHVISSILFFFECMFETKITAAEITKNGYTRSSNNHFRVHLKSSTRCAELMFRSTRYWLPLYPELVSSVQATGRRAHTRTRARVHTRPTLRIRISAARQIFRYFRTIMRRISPPGAFYVRTRRTCACGIQHPAHLSAQRRHICAAARNNERARDYIGSHLVSAVVQG